MAIAAAVSLSIRQGESPSPSSRRAPAASVSWRVPPRVYSPFPLSPFRARSRRRPMAVRATEEAVAAHTGRARWRLFRERRL